MKTYKEFKDEQLIKSLEEQKPFKHNIYSNTNEREFKKCPENGSYYNKPRY